MIEKLKVVLQALTGYAGSSENPEKFSLRMMGIITGFSSQFAPIIVLTVSKFTTLCVGMDPNACVTKFTDELGPVLFGVGCVVWLVGAIRACYVALQNSDTKLGAFLRNN